MFYNNYSMKLILGGGFNQYGIIKTITAKMLAISALCVSLLVKIGEKINLKIKSRLPKNKEK